MLKIPVVAPFFTEAVFHNPVATVWDGEIILPSNDNDLMVGALNRDQDRNNSPWDHDVYSPIPPGYLDHEDNMVNSIVTTTGPDSMIWVFIAFRSSTLPSGSQCPYVEIGMRKSFQSGLAFAQGTSSLT